jgi:glycosyltransferase involved in cell wall biosynthesis
VPPLVSCLMVTANRPGLAARAIHCHAMQTFTDSELVIVDDGDEDYSEVIARHGAPGRVRYVRLPHNPSLTLGDLRNISMDAAQGEWLVQWDDDEWYSGDRIETQLDAALRAGTGAAALKWTLMRVNIGGRPVTFRADSGLATPGTILYRRCRTRYPSMRRNEDGVFLRGIADEVGLSVLGPEAAALFVRVHHGANTWDLEHFLKRLHRVPTQWPGWLLARYVRRDLTTLPAFALDDQEKRTVAALDGWSPLTTASEGVSASDHH